MKIERMKLSAIKPYEHNAKKHPQNQIDQIAASIQEFGNNDPIAVDENGVIIEGHGRFMALQQLGYTEPFIFSWQFQQYGAFPSCSERTRNLQ